jgi:hypothetical protein
MPKLREFIIGFRPITLGEARFFLNRIYESNLFGKFLNFIIKSEELVIMILIKKV